jgi:maleate cis-trans isomerase
MPAHKDRLRIGLLVPSSNTTQEVEFARIMPDAVTLQVARLKPRNVEPSSTALIQALPRQYRTAMKGTVPVTP